MTDEMYEQLQKELREERLNSWGASCARKLLDYCLHKPSCPMFAPTPDYELVSDSGGSKSCNCGLLELKCELHYKTGEPRD